MLVFVTVLKEKRDSKKNGVTLTPWYQSRVKKATREIL
jgi:hypothetical protein